jgi:hypothetical protein
MKKLVFTLAANRKHGDETDVHKDNSNGERGDKDANVQIWPPILDDDSGCSEVIRKDDGVFEEIIPACNEPVVELLE